MIELRKIFFWIQAPVHRTTSLCHSLVQHTGRQHFRPFIFCALLLSTFSTISAQQVVIKFHPIANGKPLVLADSNYTNAFSETYRVTRLKYYVSNIGLGKDEQKNIALMDASAQDSIVLDARPGSYTTLHFTLGVDSAFNCSGAQDGALDPFNGMFWTWNSGYIFFKMEGYSNASTADLQRIEQHIGGYRFPYNAARNISLALPATLTLQKNSRYIIHVNLNLDDYWKGSNAIKIADHALIMTPGSIAATAADNFITMFAVSAVE